MDTVKIITDKQLQSAAALLIEKGSMTVQGKHEFVSGLSRRAKALGITKKIVIAQYMPGTRPPRVVRKDVFERMLVE